MPSSAILSKSENVFGHELHAEDFWCMLRRWTVRLYHWTCGSVLRNNRAVNRAQSWLWLKNAVEWQSKSTFLPKDSQLWSPGHWLSFPQIISIRCVVWLAVISSLSWGLILTPSLEEPSPSTGGRNELDLRCSQRHSRSASPHWSWKNVTMYWLKVEKDFGNELLLWSISSGNHSYTWVDPFVMGVKRCTVNLLIIYWTVICVTDLFRSFIA